MVQRQRLPISPLRGMYLESASKGSLVFRLPPYNPSGERMVAIYWNPSSFCFAIFPFHFPLEFLGLAWELHGEILWAGRMLKRHARPCMNLFGMNRWFRVVPQGRDVSFPFILFGDLRNLFLENFLWRFWDVSLWDLLGDVCMNRSCTFSFDSPPKYVSKGAQFWGFRCLRVRGILGGNPSIPLDLTSFGGP
jgi:hypothetical protein